MIGCRTNRQRPHASKIKTKETLYLEKTIESANLPESYILKTRGLSSTSNERIINIILMDHSCVF